MCVYDALCKRDNDNRIETVNVNSDNKTYYSNVSN